MCPHTAEEELQQVLYTTICVSSYCGGAGAAAGATYYCVCPRTTIYREPQYYYKCVCGRAGAAAGATPYYMCVRY